MEVIAIKKSHQNQEAELRYEIDRLKDQLQKTKEDFTKVTEKNKKVSPILTSQSYSVYIFFTSFVSDFCLFMSPLSHIYSFQTQLSSQSWKISLKKPGEKQDS